MTAAGNHRVVNSPFGGKRLIFDQVDEEMGRAWQAEKPAHVVIGLRTGKAPDLEFLPRHFPDAEDLTIAFGQVENAEAIDRLENLKSLSLSGWVGKGPLLSALPNLSEVHLRWWEGCQSVFTNPGLINLGLYESKWETLPSFSRLARLEGFSLSNCMKMSDLSTLSSAQSLRRLSLAVLPKVRRIDFLSGLPGLQVLSLHSLKNVEDYTPLGGLQSLQILELQESGAIQGMNAVGDCRKLLYLDFVGSYPKDLELAFLDRLGELRGLYFENKRGYARKRESYSAWGKGVDLPALVREVLAPPRF